MVGVDAKAMAAEYWVEFLVVFLLIVVLLTDMDRRWSHLL